MASALEEREEQSSKCFICNVKVTSRSSYNIFCSFMPQRDVLLMDVMSKILNKTFNSSQMRSSVLCRRCFTLLDELDQISARFKKLQSDIVKRYESTCIEYEEESFMSVGDSKDPLQINELSLCEQDNESKLINNEDENGEKSSSAFHEIVETIISNIQDEETIGVDDNFKESSSNIAKENNESIVEEVTDHIDNSVDNPDIIEESNCETKIRKRVGNCYKCEQCDDTFRRATDLKNHVFVVHQTSKRFFCSSCDKSYSTKQSLNNHLTKEHRSLDDKPITNQVNSNCSIKIENDSENDTVHCASDSNIDVSVDYVNDSSEGVVIDVKPEFSIDNSMYLEEVVEEENEDDDFEWKEEQQIECHEEKIFEDSSSAIDETIAPSSGSERSGKRQMKKGRKKRGSSRSGERACLPAIHACGLCGKKWRTVTELKSHIQSHSSIRPYVCEICGQAYKMKKALDVHVGMHNGIHPFTCEYCNKSFTQKVGLQKHIPIHTGYTRFQCDLCGKRFIHQKSFHIHTMTHTGEKHVKCPECGLAVLSQSHLKRHLRVHTGERPYACPICGKRFAEKYNMNAHVHIHDNNSGSGPRRNRNHICQLCGMSYDRKHKLEYHLASAHNKIDNKLPHDQETMLQSKNEYFQENSQNHQIIAMDNSNIDHSSSTAMITVSGVKLPISLGGAQVMVTTLPQQSQAANLVPLNIPAGSILSYTPTSSNDNDQPIDGTSNVYIPQNPVTIQLS